ncbi:MAG: P-loop NTPase [Planctomycetes bacterium]|nr:P-loop NTPase [Planctomycetota bacterium]
MSVTEEQILDQLRTVNDPELHRDLVSLKMIKEVTIDGGRVGVHVELTTPACPLKDQITGDVEAAVTAIEGVHSVTVEFSARVRGNSAIESKLPGVKNVIAVGAGKGGVGKSTATVLLAVGLQRAGAKVGVLDADIYGPSIPTMMGLAGCKPSIRDDKIVPLEAFGVKVMSIGFMLNPEQAVVWRGPMVHGAIKQFIDQVLVVAGRAQFPSTIPRRRKTDEIQTYPSSQHRALCLFPRFEPLASQAFQYECIYG